MDKKIILLNSLPGSQISGGNLYNQHIADACWKKGVEFKLVFNFDSSYNFDQNAIYIIDSVVLGADIDLSFLSETSAIILLHMCPSLDQNRSAEERLNLIEIEKEIFSKYPIISAGENNLDYLRSTHGLTLNRAICVEPGVSDKWTKKTEYPSLPYRLFSIGSIIPSKGLETTLNVLAQCQQYEWDWNHYGGISDESHFQYLKQLAKTLGIANRINFNGSVANGDMNQTIIDQDLLMHFSNYENNAMVIKEAIATAVPFICTPVGNYKRYQKDDIGQVAESFDVEELSEILNVYLTDPKRYGQLCQSVNDIDIGTWNMAADKMLHFIKNKFS